MSVPAQHPDGQHPDAGTGDVVAVPPVDPGLRGSTPAPRAVLRLFAAARHAAGTGRVEVAGATVGEVLDWACATYGAAFSAVLDTSRVWRNGDPADFETVLADGDEVAVLPPVSGGNGR